MSVYIDTSAFYAIVDATDANHASASAVWQRLLDEDEILLTSSYVVTEMIALLHNRFGTEIVQRFVQDNLTAVQVQWVDQPAHERALAAMLTTPGKRGPSLTDCTNLEIMRQLKTESIFAYDQHFVSLGLSVLGNAGALHMHEAG